MLNIVSQHPHPHSLYLCLCVISVQPFSIPTSVLYFATVLFIFSDIFNFHLLDPLIFQTLLHFPLLFLALQFIFETMFY